ncbi:MAG: glycosylase [Oscillospiraceae bacterium]|nr:glycosylase [Oscillospiraceae bacterium]
MPNWLKDAIFYEIYPQSFCDTNGDGIGDLPGVIKKLDYVNQLGCNAIWLNPIYDSPFMDGGYDVRDHKKVAPRYGTIADAEKLFETAHKKGIKILLDLVPGHTSDKNPWFLKSKKAAKNEYSNRYIFTDSVWESPPQYKFICGVCERDGNYMVNYFSSQPALNYGFYNVTHPAWQLPCTHSDCAKTAEALWDIMDFWLQKGADGFRVDMADSLVKNDEEKIGTAAIWREIRKKLDTNYPQAALVAEWCHPERAILNAGFHMDFYLDHRGNGYSTLFRFEENGENHSFFSPNGKGDISVFAHEYGYNLHLTEGKGYISLFTCNHDIPRMTRTLDPQAIKLAYAMIFTLPGVPFLYYGDEIGMRYLEGLVSKEGGYSRTGSRTPMQWDSSQNLGFSSAPAKKLYLPVDNAADAPTVENQKNNPDSIYKVVTDIIKLRKENPSLGNDGSFEFIYAEANQFPLVYRRGEFTVFINTFQNAVSLDFDFGNSEVVYSFGVFSFENGKAHLGGQSFVLVK